MIVENRICKVIHTASKSKVSSIAMSRGFGDFIFKLDPNLPRDKQQMIPDPECMV